MFIAFHCKLIQSVRLQTCAAHYWLPIRPYGGIFPLSWKISAGQSIALSDAVIAAMQDALYPREGSGFVYFCFVFPPLIHSLSFLDPFFVSGKCSPYVFNLTTYVWKGGESLEFWELTHLFLDAASVISPLCKVAMYPPALCFTEDLRSPQNKAHILLQKPTYIQLVTTTFLDLFILGELLTSF